jgi:hypothetical protein
MCLLVITMDEVATPLRRSNVVRVSDVPVIRGASAEVGGTTAVVRTKVVTRTHCNNTLISWTNILSHNAVPHSVLAVFHRTVDFRLVVVGWMDDTGGWSVLLCMSARRMLQTFFNSVSI